tara:strand:+ start:404 stop:604 length:201 start_codon:yes stop_codon:yes gene_type:complete
MRPHTLPAIAAWLLRHRAIVSLHTHVIEISAPPAADPADPAAVVRMYVESRGCRPADPALTLTDAP